jgi:hypothetical protein
MRKDDRTKHGIASNQARRPKHQNPHTAIPSSYRVTVTKTDPAFGETIGVVAQLLDQYGQPLPLGGRQVNWGLMQGIDLATFSVVSSLTDSNGAATTNATIRSSSTTFTIAATDTAGVTGVVTFTSAAAAPPPPPPPPPPPYVPPPGTRYYVTASSYAPPAGSQVQITAQLLDDNSNPVSESGRSVAWTKTGAGGSLAAAHTLTNASGVATVVFTVSSDDTVNHTVTATDDLGRTGTTIGVIDVQPIPAPPPPPDPPPPPPSGTFIGPAELPRVFINTAMSATPAGGRTINVPNGGDLQAALDSAIPGDTIVLAAGAVFTGNFVVRNARSGGIAGAWIHIKSAVLPSAEGVRSTPSMHDAANTAKLVTNYSNGLDFQSGTSKWRVSGIRFAAVQTSSSVNYNYGLIRIGGDETSVAQMPTDIIIDRCYLHGDPVMVQHAIATNGVRNSVIDSWIDGIFWTMTDSQCIVGWNGQGPYKIVNNYLEAASENVMYGGADPLITGLSPSDIEIRRNHMTKNLAWGHTGKNIKNLFELKHAKRVLIEGNVFRHSWVDGQIGYGLNFQSLTDRPDLAPWTQTADVVVQYNIVDDVNLGMLLSAHGYNGAGVAVSRFAVRHNLFLDVGGDPADGTVSAFGFLLGGDLHDMLFEHNTLIRNTDFVGVPLFLESGTAAKATNVSYLNNAMGGGSPYGAVFRSGGLMGAAAMAAFADGWSLEGNLFWKMAPGTWPLDYPASNHAAADQAAVMFNPDWSLNAGSPYKNSAADGTDPGANITDLLARTAGVEVVDAPVPPPPAPEPPPPPGGSEGPVQLPSTFLATAVADTPSAGGTINVAAGGDLQAALNAALPGDTIVLAAGATFTGNFWLPVKAGGIAGGWITVKSGGALPPEYTRMTPARAAANAIPKIVSPSVLPPLVTSGATSKWRLMGLEFTFDAAQAWGNGIIDIGTGAETTLEQLPSDIIVDRCYLHGFDTINIHRGIPLNGKRLAVIDSTISDIHADIDCQALGCWNGAGPLKIVNNYLASSTETIAFGGADPAIPGLVVADIEIRFNHITRPMSWKGHAGWLEKNQIEFKYGNRVLIEGNVIENAWVDGQLGWAFVLWSVNQQGSATQSEVSHMTIRKNIIRNCAAGFSLIDRYGDCIPMHHLSIHDNLCIGIANPDLLGGGYGLLVQGYVHYLRYEHNTLLAPGISALQYGPGNSPIAPLLYHLVKNNLIGGSQYPFWINANPPLTATWAGITDAATAQFAGNVAVGGAAFAAQYGFPTPTNAFPAGYADVGLVGGAAAATDVATNPANLALDAGSPYKGAGTDALDPGADVAAVIAATTNVVEAA